MVYATQKGWVVKKKKVRRQKGGRNLIGKKVCRGGSGGVPPPAKRGQEPNRFSGRVFIMIRYILIILSFLLWCTVYVWMYGVWCMLSKRTG